MTEYVSDLSYLEKYLSPTDLEQLKVINQQRHQAFPKIYSNSPEDKKCDGKEILSTLPTIPKLPFSLASNGAVAILDPENQIHHSQKAIVLETAKKLIPWRKGPFQLFETFIDSEWQSNLKWERILPHLPDLKGKRVLDLGCNNGYYLFQMNSFEPELLLGIDPVAHVWTQFQFFQHFAQASNIHMELFGTNEVPYFKNVFDVIFHMGILYHHPNPIQLLQDARNALRPGGTLLLETIGVDGTDSIAHFPQDRYAQMRNVWFFPTLTCTINWLLKCKFKNIEVLSNVLSTPEEQRATDWSTEKSLIDFLSPTDPKKTIEGLPAPRRFLLRATV